MTKIKILYLNNFEAPYRVPFYNLLGDRYNLTLMLSEKPEEVLERNILWFNNGLKKYNIKYINHKNIFCSIRSVYGIYNDIKQNDIVFMDMYGTKFNIITALLMYFSKKKFFMSVDGLLKKRRENKIKRIFKQIILYRADKILSPSSYVDDCLGEYGVNKNKIKRYHFTSVANKDLSENNTTDKKFKINLRKDLKLPSDIDAKIILTVGRFTNGSGIRKGYDILLRAMDYLPDNYYLIIVGDQPDEYFDKIFNEINSKRIILIGFKEKESLKKYYDSADIFCLQTREDIWGLVINEAMARGLPIITTRTCGAGIALVKNGENGYLGDAEDVNELVKNMRNILDDNFNLSAFGKKSRDIISDWTIENMTKDHIEIFG